MIGNRRLTPLRERNQVLVAVVGTIVGAMVVFASMNLGKVPFLHPHHTYYADFANADGLTKGRDVRVAGVSVGSVSSVRVDGDHVKVAFSINASVKLGDQSQASIEIATVLGELFMQVESSGDGTLRPGATIPVSRTTVPYTLINAFDKFGQVAGNTDLGALQDSLQQLTGTLNGLNSPDLTATLQGLQSISATLASRQTQVSDLLTQANAIVDTINAHSAALVEVLDDGDQFVQLLEQRHQLISQLLTDTANLGAQLNSLLGKYGGEISGALSNIDKVVAVLAKDKQEVETSISVLGQFAENITNADGSGPWLDIMLPYGLVPDNVIAACGSNPKPTCGGS